MVLNVLIIVEIEVVKSVIVIVLKMIDIKWLFWNNDW